MLAIKFIIFAGISTLVNLASQYMIFLTYSGLASLYVAMLFGTLTGLVAKYILDKKFIFCHVPKDKKDDAKKFALYSLMGLFTTIIFWGTEVAFDTFLKSPNAKYQGAVVGLTIGYIIKYFLDKKFVFVNKRITK